MCGAPSTQRHRTRPENTASEGPLPFLESYEKLDEDLRAELPLKRIWTVAQSEDTSLEE